MTNKEYQAMLVDIIEKFPSEETPHPAKVMCEWIKSLEAENAALTLLHTQATDQMIKMQNRVHELEAEIAQVKKDKLEFNAQCFHKDETISVLKNRITELEFDNRSLVEQMNQMAMKPNQEVIEWHSYPEEKPTETDCSHSSIVPSHVEVVIKYKKHECEKPKIGVDTYWFSFPKGNNSMFESQFDPTVIILAWAYLPKGVINEHKTN